MHMKRTFHLAALLGAGAVIAALCLPAAAGAAQFPGPSPFGATVFAQTNDPSGNQIVSYVQTGSGLRQVSRYDTGGLGTSIGGAVVDKLASQGGLTYDATAGLLVGVNGGSNTISEFHTFGPFLGFRRVVPSGGTTPVSVAVRGDLIYVLNAGGTGEVQGFYANTLTPIPGSARSLELTPGLTPPYLNTPGQIGFTPDGRNLVVTTKANGSDIDIFGISIFGGLSSAPTVNASATPVPFGFTFDRLGDLVVAEAGDSALTTYTVNGDRTLTERGSVTDGQAALCWVAAAGDRFFYGANAGSGSVTVYTINASGQPAVVGTTATDPGPIDLAATPDGSALYVETGGNDLIDSFIVSPTGSLVATGSVSPELPGHTGLEGIALG
jgi:DNA-binding beta-propeller fold protein YncE